MRSKVVLGIWALTIACAGLPAPVDAADLRKFDPGSAKASRQSLTAEAAAGAAVIQFHGLSLERAERGSSPEETVLRFKQPTDPKLAEDLAKRLPGWIDYASTGYDSLLIRAKRKASYAVTETPDGFTLRLTWAVDANEVTRTNLQRLRFLIATRQPDKARGILNDLRRRSVEPDVLDRLEADILLTENDPAAALERLDALAMSDPEDKALLRARSDLRLRLGSHVEVNARHQSIKQGDRQSHLRIATESATSLRGRITAQIETVHLKDDVLLRTDGAAGKFDSTRSRIAIGFAKDQGAGREWRASLVAGPGTIGARAQYQWLLPQSHWRLRLGLQEPNWDLTEGIAYRGRRDSAEASLEVGQHTPWFANLGLRLNRYGVDKVDDAASSLSLFGGARYTLRTGDEAALYADYTLDAEYLLSQEVLTDNLGGSYAPWPLSEREIHSLSAGLVWSIEETMKAEATLGYAHDRFGEGGIFARAYFSMPVDDHWEVSAHASYAEINSRSQSGGGGALTSFGLDLLYRFDTGGFGATEIAQRPDFGKALP